MARLKGAAGWWLRRRWRLEGTAFFILPPWAGRGGGLHVGGRHGQDPAWEEAQRWCLQQARVGGAKSCLSCRLTFTPLNVILHSLDLTLLAVCVVQSY